MHFYCPDVCISTVYLKRSVVDTLCCMNQCLVAVCSTPRSSATTLASYTTILVEMWTLSEPLPPLTFT